MSTTYSDLTAALLRTIAQTPGLAGASLVGDSVPPESANLPAATLMPREIASHGGQLAGQQGGHVEGDLDLLAKVGFELTLWRRDADRQANLLALTRLADAVTDALLIDPSQGGLAVVGPNGAATEIGRAGPGLASRVSPPMAGLPLHVACWVLPPDGLTPLADDQQVRIDGELLLASGPHELAVGDWQRRRLDRTFAGLDGVVSIDLGATTRPIGLAGRLVAADTDALLDQVAAVSSLGNGDSLHTVTAGDGRSFANVRLDHLRWGRLLAGGTDRVACVGYAMSLSQMG